MEPEENSTSRLFTEDVQNVIKKIGQLPATQTSLLLAYELYVNQQSDISEKNLFENLQEVNTKAIEEKFMSMMVDVYREIQPHLKFYNSQGSINYLDSKILSRLDKKIYPNSYRLHKFKETPMGQLLEKQDNSMTDKLFGELLDIVHELLETFQKYYQVENNGRVSEAIFESLFNFMESNENSYLMQEDRKSLKLENDRRSMIKDEGFKDKAYEEIVNIVKNVNKQSQKKGLVESTIGAIYNSTLSSGVGFVSSKIKKLNPFSYLAKDNLTEEEKQKIKYDIIHHLKPHLSIKEGIDEEETEYMMKILPQRYEQIIQEMEKEDRDKFVTIIGNFLARYSTFSETLSEIVQEMMTVCDQCSKDRKEMKKIKDNHIQIKWIIILYKVFERNYNPERRRILFKFCEEPEINYLKNTIGIVKFIESEDVVNTEFLNLLRTMPLKEKQQNKKFQLNNKKKDAISLELQHELNRIHLYELDKKFKGQPLIQFQRLSISPPKRVITLVFSGFMSEDSCKVEEWDKLLETVYDSEVFSVRWESKTFGDMFDFAVNAGKNIVEANIKIGFLGSIGGPYLRALAVMREIYKKYHENPFNPAFESSIKTGMFLAELIMSSFKGHFVNLIGFSLGTELIKNILERLAFKKQLSMVNKVYLMGGCADKHQIQHIIENSRSSLNIVNLYSDKDAILKYLLKICKPGITPIGLNPIKQIQGHEISNMDCSDFINGHLAYRERLDILSRLLNMKDD